MSNYQTDLLRHFVPDEDFVYYEDRYDLMRKLEYYLNHEDERAQIAKNGHDKIQKEHTFDIRVSQIIDIVKMRH